MSFTTDLWLAVLNAAVITPPTFAFRVQIVDMFYGPGDYEIFPAASATIINATIAEIALVNFLWQVQPDLAQIGPLDFTIPANTLTIVRGEVAMALRFNLLQATAGNPVLPIMAIVDGCSLVWHEPDRPGLIDRRGDRR
jgi:hypothetical protein